MSGAELLKLVGYFAMVAGVIGTIAPLIPGAALVWLGALLWAWADGFERVGWPTLLLLGVLAGLATAANVLLTAAGGRRGGAAWSSLVVSSLLAVIGFVLFNLPGAIVGALGGVIVAEWQRNDRQWSVAWQSSKGMLVGWLASFLAQIALVLLMLLVFAVQAFGPV